MVASSVDLRHALSRSSFRSSGVNFPENFIAESIGRLTMDLSISQSDSATSLMAVRSETFTFW